MQERILITGILGQDGAYLARHLLDLGHDVIGLGRQLDDPARLWRLHHLGVHGQVRLVELDLDTAVDVPASIAALRPDRIIHLAAQSSVARSFAEPLLTAESAGMGAVRIFEAARQLGGVPVVQPSSAEILDLQGQNHIDVHTPIGAQSPYGASKAFAHWMARVYRQSMATPVSTAILFNHESPLRGDAFVTRKIVRELVRIRRELDAGIARPAALRLGKLDALRDWSHARDIVQALWLIAERPQAADYVLASGRLHSVRDFVSLCATHLDLDLTWEGSGLAEVGRCTRHGEVRVSVDPAFYRPADPDQLPVDLRSTIEALNWRPTPSLAALIAEMCDFELTMNVNGKKAP